MEKPGREGCLESRAKNCSNATRRPEFNYAELLHYQTRVDNSLSANSEPQCQFKSSQASQTGNATTNSESMTIRHAVQSFPAMKILSASQEHVLPASLFTGRQQLFKIPYCNEKATIPAIKKIQKLLPLRRGDLLWLLDQFLRDEFPAGGTLNCADPSVFSMVHSIWPKLIAFCSQQRYFQNPVFGIHGYCS